MSKAVTLFSAEQRDYIVKRWIAWHTGDDPRPRITVRFYEWCYDLDFRRAGSADAVRRDPWTVVVRKRSPR